MYARALRAVQVALRGGAHENERPMLFDAVETMLADEILLPLVVPVQRRLADLTALRLRLELPPAVGAGGPDVERRGG